MRTLRYIFSTHNIVPIIIYCLVNKGTVVVMKRNFKNPGTCNVGEDWDPHKSL